MTRSTTTRIITIGLLAGALGVVVARRSGWSPAFTLPDTLALPSLRTLAPSPAPATPEDAIYAMLDAVRAGDADRYLDSYTGPLHDAIRQARIEQGHDGFVRYLRDTNAAIRGISLSDVAPVNDGTRVRVEYVYADRNEVQAVFLRQDRGAWKIYRVDSAQRSKTLVPYGTPVND